MANARFFVPQERLDLWVADHGVLIDEERLVIPGVDRRLDLTPAVRFTREVTGEGDPHGLVGKVKTGAQLEEIGADHYRDSVLVGEAAYEVIEGFVTALSGAAASQTAEPPGREAPAAPPPTATLPDEEASDAESLARLLIEKLD